MVYMPHTTAVALPVHRSRSPADTFDLLVVERWDAYLKVVNNGIFEHI